LRRQSCGDNVFNQYVHFAGDEEVRHQENLTNSWSRDWSIFHGKQEIQRRWSALACISGLIIIIITAIILSNDKVPKPRRQNFWPISKAPPPETHLIRNSEDYPSGKKNEVSQDSTTQNTAIAASIQPESSASIQPSQRGG
jgi:hypothetical protein